MRGFKKQKIVNDPKQASLFGPMGYDDMTKDQDKKIREPALAPATPVMKAVAVHVPMKEQMKRTFTQEEIDEIMVKREAGEQLNKKEVNELRKKFQKMKRFALEKEKTNNQQVIFVPCIMDDKGFYKAYNISALYYGYRVADRVGRKAQVRPDTDSYSKALHTVSLANMPKFIEEFKRIANVDLEITDDGIHIFTLREPLSEDEIGMLRRTEQMRRDTLHGVLRPAAMDPKTFNEIMTLVRQVAPKVKKLDRQNYYLYGEEMQKSLQKILKIYYNFADGIIDRKEAGLELLEEINTLLSCLGVLAELDIWGLETSSVVGANVANLKRIVNNNFIERTKNEQ